MNAQAFSFNYGIGIVLQRVGHHVVLTVRMVAHVLRMGSVSVHLVTLAAGVRHVSICLSGFEYLPVCPSGYLGSRCDTYKLTYMCYIIDN